MKALARWSNKSYIKNISRAYWVKVPCIADKILSRLVLCFRKIMNVLAHIFTRYVNSGLRNDSVFFEQSSSLEFLKISV